MKRFIDYRTLEEENNESCEMAIWERHQIEIETPTFQSLTDVLFALSKWYKTLDVIEIENLDFRKIEEQQLHEIYMEEERRGRHGKRKKEKEEEDDIMPF